MQQYYKIASSLKLLAMTVVLLFFAASTHAQTYPYIIASDSILFKRNGTGGTKFEIKGTVYPDTIKAKYLKNNTAGDSVLTTDKNGKFKLKKLTSTFDPAPVYNYIDSVALLKPDSTTKKAGTDSVFDWYSGSAVFRFILSSTGLTDGNYGDVTVGGTGTTMDVTWANGYTTYDARYLQSFTETDPLSILKSGTTTLGGNVTIEASSLRTFTIQNTPYFHVTTDLASDVYLGARANIEISDRDMQMYNQRGDNSDGASLILDYNPKGRSNAALRSFRDSTSDYSDVGMLASVSAGSNDGVVYIRQTDGNIRMRFLTNLSSQDRLIGQSSTASDGYGEQLGYITMGYGETLASGVLKVDTTSSTGLVSKDRLTNAIAGITTPSLQQVTNVGNETTTAIRTNDQFYVNSVNTGSGSTNYSILGTVVGGSGNIGGSLYLKSIYGATTPSSTTYGWSIYGTNITADRILNLPNASGTIALTSDIPSLSGYEVTSNKATDFSTVNNTKYPTTQAVVNYVTGLPVSTFTNDAGYITSAITSVTDSTFDLNVSGNVVSFYPYSAKKGSNPSYAYFYNGTSTPTFTNRINLDGDLYTTNLNAGAVTSINYFGTTASIRGASFNKLSSDLAYGFINYTYDGSLRWATGEFNNESSGNVGNDYEIWSYTNAGANLQIPFRIKRQTGALRIEAYGSGSITGTATYNLAVDASGNLIEVALGGGSGETNTASNLGGGLANYSTKVGVDLRFNSFDAADFDLASNLISIDATKWLTITAADAAYQPLDADLTYLAGVTLSANVKTLLGAADYAAFKTSLSLNNVENTALSTWAGSANITTLGTIATGVWNGTAIGDTYISSASTWNGKQAGIQYKDEGVNLGTSATVTSIDYVGANVTTTRSTNALTVTIATQTTVSGNAGTATALQNSRTLWGQSFDGTANVTGDMTSVGSITASKGGLVLDITNSTNAVSNQFGKFSGTNTTRAANDLIYASYFLANSAGTQKEFVRLNYKAPVVTNTSEDGSFIISLMKAGTLTDIATLTKTSFNVITGVSYQINGSDVLTNNTLGSGVTASSLTSVGTLATGTWQASVISSTYGGTGVNNGARTLTINTNNVTIASSNQANTLTLANNLTTSGNFALTLTTTATTNVTLPTTGTLSTIAGTETFTNKRITARVTSITSNATWSPSADNDDVYIITAQAVAVTTISNPSGTPTDGQKLIIRVKDDGTARALTWSGTQWRASTDQALPTTTVISKTMYIAFMWNAADSKWDCVAVNNGF